MNKILETIEGIRKGERSRVLFSMLCDHIGFTTKEPQQNFWVKLKDSIDTETEGHLYLTNLTKEEEDRMVSEAVEEKKQSLDGQLDWTEEIEKERVTTQ